MLKEICKYIYGHQDGVSWSAMAGMDLNVNSRTVERWNSGAMDIPPEHLQALAVKFAERLRDDSLSQSMVNFTFPENFYKMVKGEL